MSKCKQCGKWVGYMEIYCSKCRKELAGTKPRKSRDLCSDCYNNFYNNKYPDKNAFGGKGCMGYKGSEVVIKDVHKSIHSVDPNPKWKLGCFNKQY